MNALGASFVQAGGNLISSLVNGALNMWEGSINRKWSENMYLKYQSPQAQMQQMIEAGINPNTAAAGIAGSGGAQLMNTASGNSFNLGELGSDFNQAAIAKALADAEVKNKNADTSVKETIAEGNTIENEAKKQTFDDVVAGIKSKNAAEGYKAEQLRPYAEHADEWYKINFDNLDEKAKLIRKQIDEIDERIKNLAKQRSLMETEMGLNQAQTWYNNELARLQQQKNELFESLGADSVETAYVRASVEGDGQKAGNIKSAVKSYVTAEKESEESARQGVKNEENPEQAWEKKLYDDLQKDLAPLDKEIAETKKEIERYNKGLKKDNMFGTGRSNAEFHLNTLENKRDNLIEEYNKNLRSRKSNSHVNVGPVGVTK